MENQENRKEMDDIGIYLDSRQMAFTNWPVTRI